MKEYFYAYAPLFYLVNNCTAHGLCYDEAVSYYKSVNTIGNTCIGSICSPFKKNYFPFDSWLMIVEESPFFIELKWLS